MSGRDIAPQVKKVFDLRQKERKHKKIIKGTIFALIIAVCIAGGVIYYSKHTIATYSAKHAELEVAKSDFELEKEKVEKERQEVLEEAEMIAQTNLYLAEQNMKLQESLQLAASVGVKPQNYDEPDEIESPVDYDKLEYIGEFEGTAYTPSVEECSNNLGYTASGKPIIAGVSIAVDNKYWKLGTKFYIEGLGYVVAMDTGNAVKGKYRFDYAVFDRDYALKLGRRKYNVYLVKED